MRINIYKSLKLFFIACSMLSLAPVCVIAQDTAFIGEDLYDPRGSGVVISVNEFKHKPFESGLRGTSKREDVFVNLTLVNAGNESFEINPAEDFYLQVDKIYKPETGENRGLLSPFQLFPTMQTRLDLNFLVDEIGKNTPSLFFKINDSRLKILCKSNSEELLKAESSNMDVSEVIENAKVLIETDRLDEARKLLLVARSKDPENSLILMMLANVEEKDGEPEMASTYIKAISSRNISVDEAVELAKMSIRLEYPTLAVKALQDFYNRGMLNSEQKLLLAKAYYVQERFSRAEFILMPMISSGQASRDAHFIMGNIFNRKQDLNRAITQWEMVLDIDPNDAQAMFNIGVAYYKQQNISKAQEYWRKVLGAQPDAETMKAAEDALKATQY